MDSDMMATGIGMLAEALNQGKENAWRLATDVAAPEEDTELEEAGRDVSHALRLIRLATGETRVAHLLDVELAAAALKFGELHCRRALSVFNSVSFFDKELGRRNLSMDEVLGELSPEGRPSPLAAHPNNDVLSGENVEPEGFQALCQLFYGEDDCIDPARPR